MLNEALKLLGIIGGVSVIFVGALYVIGYVLCLHEYCKDAVSKVSFKQFKSFYTINPDRWTFEREKPKSIITGMHYTLNTNATIKIKTSIVAHTRIYWYLRHLAVKEMKLVNVKTINRIINTVKSDIAETEKRAAAELEHARKITEAAVADSIASQESTGARIAEQLNGVRYFMGRLQCYSNATKTWIDM